MLNFPLFLLLVRTALSVCFLQSLSAAATAEATATAECSWRTINHHESCKVSMVPLILDSKLVQLAITIATTSLMMLMREEDQWGQGEEAFAQPKTGT